MKPFTAVIVDDEPEALDLLANIITDHVPELFIIAKAATADQANELVLNLYPDIIFLDIDMPGKNGFEVARTIASHNLNTTVVFVTGFNQYAIDAIKVAAFDYLLKPIELNDLKECIKRLTHTKKTENLQQSITKLLKSLNSEKLTFHSRHGIIFIDPAEIVYCRAEGNYTDIFLIDGKKHTLSQKLGFVEGLLDGKGFAKISRSVSINKRFLSQIIRKEKHCILVAAKQEYTLDIKYSYIRKWEV